MTGYAYHGLVRITPENGAARVLDLRSEFRDAQGQARTRVDYEFEAEDYEDVNRRLRRTAFGFRVEVRLSFDILTTADHAALADIVSALASTDTVELSLDAGFVYREVVMTDAPSPRPFRNKTYIGARHDLRLECVELLDEMPTMNTEGGW